MVGLFSSRVDAKELNFGLIWPQNILPSLLWSIRCSLTGLVHVLSWAGGPCGRFRISVISVISLRRSVLPMDCMVTLAPTALRSLTSSSRVVLGWSLTFLMIILTPWGEILHGAPDRGWLMVILYFFHFRIIASTVVSFSSSFLLMVF